MPIQGSGSISLSELATEFGGQAPHSLTEYLKDAGLVDSTRAITGSESYTSLVTGDQVGTTGIYVNGVTVSHNTTTPRLLGKLLPPVAETTNTTVTPVKTAVLRLRPLLLQSQ